MEIERVAVVGSREYPDLEYVREFVRTLPPGTVVITGGARGVDQTAEDAARAAGLSVVVHRPDYERWGKTAPLRRNQRIADDCTRMVAFWNGDSRGTTHATICAQRQGKLVQIRMPRRPTPAPGPPPPIQEEPGP